MAYKDEALIAEHPNKTAYELLQLGLSQDKYNELVAGNYVPEGAKESQETAIPIEEPAPVVIQAPIQDKKVAPVTKEAPKPRRTQKAAPEVRQAAQPKLHKLNVPANGNRVPMATLVNRKTGKRTKMSRAIALKVAKMDKGNYDVI